jgi:hypothetical protein
VGKLQCYVLLLDVQIIPRLKDNSAETKAGEIGTERDKERRITEFPTNGGKQIAVIHILIHPYELSNLLTKEFFLFFKILT